MLVLNPTAITSGRGRLSGAGLELLSSAQALLPHAMIALKR
jgi:hypothetical protein